MAVVTIATLEGLKVKPVSGSDDALVQAGFQRFTTVHGPLRVEYNWFQQATVDSFSASDTFKSGLNRPRYADVKAVRRNTSASVGTSSATVESIESNVNYKTVTVKDVDTQSALGILVTVYGV